MNEKSLRANIEVLKIFKTIVGKYQKKFLTVPVLTPVIGDAANFWANHLPETQSPFKFTKAKADAKALKSLLLCLYRLRYRADSQRNEEVSRLADAHLELGL